MPLYDYQCLDCQVQDRRVAGLDDQTALCHKCGGLMLRLDEDLFSPYFGKQPDCPWCVGSGNHQGTSKICLRHYGELKQEVEELDHAPEL